MCEGRCTHPSKQQQKQQQRCAASLCGCTAQPHRIMQPRSVGAWAVPTLHCNHHHVQPPPADRSCSQLTSVMAAGHTLTVLLVNFNTPHQAPIAVVATTALQAQCAMRSQPQANPTHGLKESPFVCGHVTWSAMLAPERLCHPSSTCAGTLKVSSAVTHAAHAANVRPHLACFAQSAALLGRAPNTTNAQAVPSVACQHHRVTHTTATTASTPHQARHARLQLQRVRLQCTCSTKRQAGSNNKHLQANIQSCAGAPQQNIACSAAHLCWCED